MEGSLINLRNPPGAGPIITTLPTWKLYDNPHYSEWRCNDSTIHLHSSSCNPPYVRLILASELESSLAALLGPMDCDRTPSELELAQAQIKELKAELEFERRMRRKVESLNKVMARELTEERKAAREAAHGLRRRLEGELARKQEEVERVLRDIDEERRMLRIAEVWREERVQMKLSEARLLMEEKLQEMAAIQSKREMPMKGEEVGELKVNTVPSIQIASCENGENMSENNGGTVGSTGQASHPNQQRREPENPHIKRGIKGFVEFPRVVRVHSSSKEGRVHLGSNIECQRAQLRILLRHRNPVSLGLLGNSENLVM